MKKVRLKKETKIALSMVTGALAGAALTGIAFHGITARYPEIALPICLTITAIAIVILLADAAAIHLYVEEDYKADLMTADDLRPDETL